MGKIVSTMLEVLAEENLKTRDLKKFSLGIKNKARSNTFIGLIKLIPLL